MDSELFLKWLEHFVKYARQERPLLLFMDQHDTHVGTRVVDFCRANQIEVACLPSHATHVLQPLDVSVYGPLKAAFSDLARHLGLVRGNLIIGKKNFTPVLKVALEPVTHTTSRVGSRTQACSRWTGRQWTSPSFFLVLQLVKGLTTRPRDEYIDQEDRDDDSSTSHPSTGEDTPTASTSHINTAAANAVPDPVPLSTTVVSTSVVANQDNDDASTAAAPKTTAVATTTGQCPTCRRFPNPLVRAGVIPVALAEILMPPQFDRPSRGRGRRMPLPARVITSDTHAALLAEKRAEEARREQARQDLANQRVVRQQQEAAQRTASAAGRAVREAAKWQKEAAQQEARQQREALQASARAAREAQEADRELREAVRLAFCGQGG
ncbi:uncharacterized protein LOC121717883 [Alosa sapidissima]|uniref:uncharacterized protein LOC121717883 n=1 Tax=Alosa sapidissima TaxID=34773 RepID=UPI001C093C68|nr:uncharacterized protein LOC121717883 [Alosa sapidissima]